MIVDLDLFYLFPLLQAILQHVNYYVIEGPEALQELSGMPVCCIAAQIVCLLLLSPQPPSSCQPSIKISRLASHSALHGHAAAGLRVLACI